MEQPRPPSRSIAANLGPWNLRLSLKIDTVVSQIDACKNARRLLVLSARKGNYERHAAGKAGRP